MRVSHRRSFYSRVSIQSSLFGDSYSSCNYSQIACSGNYGVSIAHAWPRKWLDGTMRLDQNQRLRESQYKFETWNVRITCKDISSQQSTWLFVSKTIFFLLNYWAWTFIFCVYPNIINYTDIPYNELQKFHLVFENNL